uniref:probable pectate lyase 5 n=1 Tax=Erigeron canadensis TaxID=72917 RepID=UPI001CB9D17C|nr:probable pectate lyase 5 [Erigeron canadensis]
MHRPNILLFCLLTFFFLGIRATPLNLTLPYQHPNPEAVVEEVQRRLNVSIHRRQLLLDTAAGSNNCLTGNPIDDCWKCDPNWFNDRQRLAGCGIGFGRLAFGGKGGQYYTVTSSSDDDPVNPIPGTLRHAALQTEPLWIVFASNMLIKLKHELLVNSYKTLDGRGVKVEITGGGCITVQNVTNVIIHNIRVYDCVPVGNADIRSSPTQVGRRGLSDGDAISIKGSTNIWVDHCSLAHCTDGLIDATLGSTAITISNNYFTDHNEVMLMGHDDAYLADKGMQATFAFNRFGRGLVQRMPRCRHGYFHVVNNDYTEWKMYAIGGSANPTIYSQGNRFVAPADPNAKQVTRRVDADEKVWAGWNWRTDGDLMENGAFFVPSGQNGNDMYASVDPKSANFVEQLTTNAGVFDVRNMPFGGVPVTPPGGGGVPVTPPGGGGVPVTPPGGGGVPVTPPGGGGVPVTPPGGGGVPVTPPGGGGVPVTRPRGGGVPVTRPRRGGDHAGMNISGGNDTDFGIMIFGSGAVARSPAPTTIFLSSLILFVISSKLSKLFDYIACF